MNESSQEELLLNMGSAKDTRKNISLFAKNVRLQMFANKGI